MSRKAIALFVAVFALGCSRDREDGGARSASVTASANGSPGEATGVNAGAGGDGASPIGPPPPPPLARPLRVLVGGDLLPHRPSLTAPSAIAAALAPLGGLFAQADAVVANYESATGEPPEKSPRLAYAAPPGWLGVLPKAGIRAVTVANNHACDLGEPGLEATLEEAGKSGVVAIGGDMVDPWTPRTLVEANGKRICAVAWTTLSNSEGACARGRRMAVAPLTPAGKQRIDRALARARARCDATVAIFHGGAEYVSQTTQVIDQAAHAAEAGADAVVIHHPHVASPIVVHTTKDGRKVPLFASVGNLVTNQGESWKPPMFPVLPENRRLVCVNGWTRLGVLADLSFDFGEKRPRLDWGTHLVWIENEHADDRTVAVPKIEARLLEPEKDRAIVAKLSEDGRGPVALFSDPCWLERGTGEGERADECSSRTAASAAGGGRADGWAMAAAAAAPAPATNTKVRARKHGPSRRAK